MLLTKQIKTNFQIIILFLSIMSSSLAFGNNRDVEIKELQLVNQHIAEIKKIKTQLFVAKAQKYAAVAVEITGGLATAYFALSRVTSLTESGFRFSFQRNIYSTQAELATVGGAAVTGAGAYYVSLKNKEIDQFIEKLSRTEQALEAARAGLHVEVE